MFDTLTCYPSLNFRDMLGSWFSSHPVRFLVGPSFSLPCALSLKSRSTNMANLCLLPRDSWLPLHHNTDHFTFPCPQHLPFSLWSGNAYSFTSITFSGTFPQTSIVLITQYWNCLSLHWTLNFLEAQIMRNILGFFSLAQDLAYRGSVILNLYYLLILGMYLFSVPQPNFP